MYQWLQNKDARLILEWNVSIPQSWNGISRDASPPIKRQILMQCYMNRNELSLEPSNSRIFSCVVRPMLSICCIFISQYIHYTMSTVAAHSKNFIQQVLQHHMSIFCAQSLEHTQTIISWICFVTFLSLYCDVNACLQCLLRSVINWPVTNNIC